MAEKVAPRNNINSLCLLFPEKQALYFSLKRKVGKRNFGYRGVFQAPLCKGSCRRKPTEGLFFTTLPPLSRSRTPLGEACKHAPHTCKSLSHKRGLIKIKSRLCRTASLRSSLLSFISKSPAEAGLFVLQIFCKIFIYCGTQSCESV